MNESLTNSRPGISFCGKAHNNHPQWHNQPIRLTKEQKREPLLVLDDFFECYHLNDVRQLLWDWLTEVISSQRSIASDPLDRNNHMYFYEKIEEIIEVAFVLKKRMHKDRRKQEKRKQLKSNQVTTDQDTISKGQLTSILTRQYETAENSVVTLDKEKRLIEYANEDPLYVIKEVFDPKNQFTSDQVKGWLSITLLTECNAYDDSEQREQLKTFHDDLLILTDCLYVIYSSNTENANSNLQGLYIYKVSVLSQEQIVHPEKAIAEFFKKYTTTYINRELEDWLEAAICYTGKWPDELFCRGQLLDTHRYVCCLIKSAERLLGQNTIAFV
jgi:hypothetical protein